MRWGSKDRPKAPALLDLRVARGGQSCSDESLQGNMQLGCLPFDRAKCLYLQFDVHCSAYSALILLSFNNPIVVFINQSHLSFFQALGSRLPRSKGRGKPVEKTVLQVRGSHVHHHHAHMSITSPSSRGTCRLGHVRAYAGSSLSD